MENYFVVLQLPVRKKQKFSEGETSPADFRKDAVAAIHKGGAKIISMRTDTGSAEEIRRHIAAQGGYRTFVILTLSFKKFPGRRSLLNRAAQHITSFGSPATIIESEEKFQVLAL